MKDPTIPDATNRKKIMFYDSSERQTKLRIRCEVDSLSQSQFFRMMISGYIENNDLIYEFIKQYKQEHNLLGQLKRNKIERIRENSKQIENKFALKSDEIEDIFDIIETETNL